MWLLSSCQAIPVSRLVDTEVLIHDHPSVRLNRNLLDYDKRHDNGCIVLVLLARDRPSSGSRAIYRGRAHEIDTFGHLTRYFMSLSPAPPKYPISNCRNWGIEPDYLGSMMAVTPIPSMGEPVPFIDCFLAAYNQECTIAQTPGGLESLFQKTFSHNRRFGLQGIGLCV